MGPWRPPQAAFFDDLLISMPSRKTRPAEIAAQIRHALKDGGSAEHAAGVQWFFKEEIKSHGWYTGDLRRAMRRCRRDILRKHDFNFLVGVADKLFSGKVLEEKAAAVFLLEKMDAQCGNREFRMFDSWLNRISSWADHDGLVHCLIAPMVAAKPARIKNVFRWAKSPKRWHRRGENALSRDREAFRLAALRPRRHGAEGPGLAAARNGKIRSEAHRTVSNEDSRAGSAARIADRVRACSFRNSR